VPYILDFAISVSVLTPERYENAVQRKTYYMYINGPFVISYSYLPCEILRNFTDYIVALPLRKQIKNIRNFLKAFEYAMRLKDIPPKVGERYNK
jgi:hypothetical protein